MSLIEFWPSLNVHGDDLENAVFAEKKRKNNNVTGIESSSRDGTGAPPMS